MIQTLYVALGLLICTGAFGEESGTITQVEGNVKIFSHPTTASNDLKGPPPHAKFEGTYYSVSDAKLGDRVAIGNILRTLEGGKVRVVYDNGDQFNVGEATSFRLKKSKGMRAKIDYGKLRGIISKDGPRRRLKISTKSATMGIRGTDFYIDDAGWRGETVVSVLRGQVDVENVGDDKKVIEVKPGFRAQVEKKVISKKKKPKQHVTVARIDKTDLLTIQHVSTIQKRIPAAMKEELREKIDELETKATNMTLDDIKKSDPKLYEDLSKKKSTTTAQVLNSEVVKTIYKVAPEGKARKPGEEELSDLEKNAYEKYFEAN